MPAVQRRQTWIVREKTKHNFGCAITIVMLVHMQSGSTPRSIAQGRGAEGEKQRGRSRG